MENNCGKTVHDNHFLMGGAREKLVQFYLSRRQKLMHLLKQKDGELSPEKMSHIRQEIIAAFEKQLFHFTHIAQVMEKIDYPKEFWQKSRQKMISELSNFKNQCST